MFWPCGSMSESFWLSHPPHDLLFVNVAHLLLPLLRLFCFQSVLPLLNSCRVLYSRAVTLLDHPLCGVDTNDEAQSGQPNSDADDFYVFIYDEEDNSITGQMQFKKGSRGMKSFLTQRVLGFWCFNAGIGFKQIQKLQPRSIILTSGTLSPLPSFEAELQLEFK